MMQGKERDERTQRSSRWAGFAEEAPSSAAQRLERETASAARSRSAKKEEEEVSAPASGSDIVARSDLDWIMRPKS